jgi:hypothetical protein
MRHTDTYRHRQYKTHSLAASADGLVVCGKKKKKTDEDEEDFTGRRLSLDGLDGTMGDGLDSPGLSCSMNHGPLAHSMLSLATLPDRPSGQSPRGPRDPGWVCTVWTWERAQGPAPAASKSRLNATNSRRSRGYSLPTPYSQSSLYRRTHIEAANTQIPRHTRIRRDTPINPVSPVCVGVLLNAPPALLCTASHCSPRASYGTHIALL